MEKPPTSSAASDGGFPSAIITINPAPGTPKMNLKKRDLEDDAEMGMEDFMTKFSIGDDVWVISKGQWHKAKTILIETDKYPGDETTPVPIYKIHYPGWGKKYDEWMFSDSLMLQNLENDAKATDENEALMEANGIKKKKGKKTGQKEKNTTSQTAKKKQGVPQSPNSVPLDGVSSGRCRGRGGGRGDATAKLQGVTSSERARNDAGLLTGDRASGADGQSSEPSRPASMLERESAASTDKPFYEKAQSLLLAASFGSLADGGVKEDEGEMAVLNKSFNGSLPDMAEIVIPCKEIEESGEGTSGRRLVIDQSADSVADLSNPGVNYSSNVKTDNTDDLEAGKANAQFTKSDEKSDDKPSEEKPASSVTNAEKASEGRKDDKGSEASPAKRGRVRPPKGAANGAKKDTKTDSPQKSHPGRKAKKPEPDYSGDEDSLEDDMRESVGDVSEEDSDAAKCKKKKGVANGKGGAAGKKNRGRPPGKKTGASAKKSPTCGKRKRDESVEDEDEIEYNDAKDEEPSEKACPSKRGPTRAARAKATTYEKKNGAKKNTKQIDVAWVAEEQLVDLLLDVLVVIDATFLDAQTTKL